MSDVKTIIDLCKEEMNQAISHLENELAKVRAGRANPSMLESVMVDYYGSTVPMSQVANVSTTDARTIRIQPWEKNMLNPIAEAIMNSNLSLNPQNNGEVLIISIPPLTEERRKELCKKAKSEGEDAKISIRNHRRDANEAVKKLQKDGLPEDEAKDGEAKIQDLTNTFSTKIDQLVEQKEKDIMTV
ncbi:MAG TPA: ribosome recycling factor [Flavobacteriales bacterium]|nr:ribosome recycling factor [Flavobacteriales bacterium]HCA83250.1 ribosome recycling factor [Flavobacteriales bacterium]HRE73778.1 ribosome recycling factor [Flavobacteriales bacterium]HRJ35610.1 ribosome recycling factor [Flavobacteriales bacterium]HRJ39148.1 ribosome recycling factor [Flavobacteriales bacterium]